MALVKREKVGRSSRLGRQGREIVLGERAKGPREKEREKERERERERERECERERERGRGGEGKGKGETAHTIPFSIYTPIPLQG